MPRENKSPSKKGTVKNSNLVNLLNSAAAVIEEERLHLKGCVEDLTTTINDHTRKSRKPNRRRVVGIYVKDNKTGPFARLIYEVEYSDGTSLIEKGFSVFATRYDATPSDTKKYRELQQLRNRPELYHAMKAAAILIDLIEDGCRVVDEKSGLVEF